MTKTKKKKKISIFFNSLAYLPVRMHFLNKNLYKNVLNNY